jgi:hypothetical protein
MSRACSKHWIGNNFVEVLVGTPEEESHLENLGVVRNIFQEVLEGTNPLLFFYTKRTTQKASFHFSK